MYCKKLENIIRNPESDSFQITISTIKQFDYFVKNKLSSFELDNINPIKFSIEMKINYETSLMFFIIGSRESLFQLQAFYYCECGIQHKIENLEDELECECENTISPAHQRDRVFLYFKLLENPTPCNSFSTNRESQLDYLKGEYLMEKQQLSLADLDTVIGVDSSNQILINQSREETFKRYLEE
ncbi:hypothetical protein [Alkalihalophilus marmarensis]|uniref:hypothetical protein n=1 Tax=Alkalihalophilus marmarensis TaxID=521377 RepID=UPI002DBA9888|nr:hypothetical protein [Alkalihalophilus marmarensis]MEC2073198.1 hypothetical protein [Alkalihalophilus marmarensis]